MYREDKTQNDDPQRTLYTLSGTSFCIPRLLHALKDFVTSLLTIYLLTIIFVEWMTWRQNSNIVTMYELYYKLHNIYKI